MKQLKIYTVAQVNSLIKGILENNLPGQLTMTGQITDLRPHHSGHCYFSLKDEKSKLPCAMWKSYLNKVKFEIENGLAVLATGFIDVYIPHGRYQFIAEKLVPAGVGELRLAFEQMVKKLQTEGLFNEAHKKELPAYPMRIGIATSESGAAVGDIATSVQGRWPCAKLFLYPVPVQGKTAAEQIAKAIRDLNKRNKELKLDILIVGRGGGSLEDLWAFNEEVLARAIFDSKIPIISAVGHEYDTTIADLVADKRASTPTKAGVTAVPDIEEITEQLIYIENRLSSNLTSKLKICRQMLLTFLASSVFRNPLLPICNRQQQLDQLEMKLSGSMNTRFAAAKANLSNFYNKVATIEPHRLLAKKNIDLNNMKNRINETMKTILSTKQLQITAQANRLEALNPKSVLHRGYSITTNKKTGLLIRNSQDVNFGDALITELADENLVESKVINKQNRANEN